MAIAGNLLCIGAVGTRRAPVRPVSGSSSGTSGGGGADGALPSAGASAPDPKAVLTAAGLPGDEEGGTGGGIPPKPRGTRPVSPSAPPSLLAASTATATALASASAIAMAASLLAGHGWSGRDVMRGWTAGLQCLAAAYACLSLAASPSGRFACCTGRGRLAAAGLAAAAAQAAIWQVWWPLAGTAAAAAAPAGAVGGGGGYMTFRGGAGRTAAAVAWKASCLGAALADIAAAYLLGIEPPLPPAALLRPARPALVGAALALGAAAVGVAICAVGTFDTSSTNEVSPVGGRNPAWLAVLSPQAAALALAGAVLSRPDWLARGCGGAACALAIPAGVVMLLAASPGVSGTILAGLCLCAGGGVGALLALGFGGADPLPAWVGGGGEGRRATRAPAGGEGGEDGNGLLPVAALGGGGAVPTIRRRAAGSAADVALEALLGSGSSGAVYRGRWHDTLVAVKVIKAAGAAAAAAAAAAAREAFRGRAPPTQGGEEAAAAAPAAPAPPPDAPGGGGGPSAVEREARLSLSLQHPNVVATYDVIHVRMGGSRGRGGGAGEGGDAGAPASFLSRLLSRRGRRRRRPATDGDDDDGGDVTAGPSPGELDETWIVLEYCDRGNLEVANRRGRLRMKGGGGGGAPAPAPATPSSTTAPTTPRPPATTPDLAVIYACLRDIASGLAYLHSVGVVHGDVKPANVLLKSLADDPAGRGWVAKLADFGLSRVLDTKATHASTLNFGTLAFMPPELIRDGRCSPAADVYSFGMVMWELWSGGAAFAGTPPPALFYKVAFEGARPEPLGGGVPPEYVALMHACWAAEPGARPSAGGVVRALRPLAGSITWPFLMSRSYTLPPVAKL